MGGSNHSYHGKATTTAKGGPQLPTKKRHQRRRGSAAAMQLYCIYVYYSGKYITNEYFDH